MTIRVTEQAPTATAAAPQTPPAERPGGFTRLIAVQKQVPVVQLVLLVAVFLVGVVTLPGFGSPVSIASILILSALAGLASVGQTLVVIIGGFDLSVAGFIVAGALMVTQFAQVTGLSFTQALLLIFPVFLVLGGLTGYICHRFNVHPIIISLAMGSIALGLVRVVSGTAIVGSPPAFLRGLTSPIGGTFGIPIPPIVAIWIIVAVGMALFLHRTVAGRKLYATGANPRAAEYSLVRTRWFWVGAFAFSGLCSGLVGVALVAFAGSVDSSLGDPYLFISLAAVIVGGTVFGGPGDYTRTIVGALVLTTITTVLVGYGLVKADQQIMYGAIILLAMAIYGRDKKLKDRV
ncbi:MAG: hypothetical protein JWQ19_3035 [Subtercola sp.]|nr:hypothetical protein [Subtercola sp.]